VAPPPRAPARQPLILEHRKHRLTATATAPGGRPCGTTFLTKQGPEPGARAGGRPAIDQSGPCGAQDRCSAGPRPAPLLPRLSAQWRSWDLPGDGYALCPGAAIVTRRWGPLAALPGGSVSEPGFMLAGAGVVSFRSGSPCAVVGCGSPGCAHVAGTPSSTGWAPRRRRNAGDRAGRGSGRGQERRAPRRGVRVVRARDRDHGDPRWSHARLHQPARPATPRTAGTARTASTGISARHETTPRPSAATAAAARPARHLTPGGSGITEPPLCPGRRALRAPA